MGNTNLKKKRERLYRMVVDHLRLGGEVHIRDLVFFIENNSRYKMTPLGLGHILKPHVSSGRLIRIRPTGHSNASMYAIGEGDSLK